ncbi:hypothetical protein GUJ93_ZPchr2178g2963 [Zizania palustris]|uniref:Uncharacterized protein n=1 Tax=Zizania palustris TaxID=103762 RepID=A0A8J5R074_ZIZPA|nr:hypothetical protein GUJ93_ZPchr2178g2963 [Zizania palustris]
MQPMEAPRFMWWVDEFAAAVAVGALRHTPSRMTKAKAKAPKKRFMSDLFMDAPSLTLPPPADASGRNEAMDEDDNEALCTIIRWTKQMKRKHKLDETVAVAAAKAVGRPESEWNFIREIEISLPFFDRLGIHRTINVSDFGGLAGHKYTSLRFLFLILIKKCICHVSCAIYVKVVYREHERRHDSGGAAAV